MLGIVINGGNVSIQISGGPGVADIQSGLATAAALATLAATIGDPANSSLVARLEALAHPDTVGGWRIARAQWSCAADGGTIGDYPIFIVNGIAMLIPFAFVTGSPDAGIFSLSPAKMGLGGKAFDEGFNVGDIPWLPLHSFPIPAVECILRDESIYFQITSETVTTGTIEFFCIWAPLSAGATVVAAC